MAHPLVELAGELGDGVCGAALWLYFPKGQIKSFAEAFAKAGLPTQGLADVNLKVPLQELDMSSLDGI